MLRSIVEWSIRALLMVAGTGLVLSVLRVRRASVLHSAWAATMVAMLLLPVWTKWGPSVSAPVLPEEPFQTAMDFAPVIVATPRIAVTPQQAAPAVPRSLDWQHVLVWIYIAGLAAMVARLVVGTLRARWIVHSAREVEGFMTSDLCAAPVTIGWLRPVLLLPSCWRTWPAGKLEAVLIHEREHARRRDPLVQWVALLNRCLFWFHPAAWWLERRLAALAEEACDAAVLAGGIAAHDYAGYLIELARSLNETGSRIRPAGAVAFADGRLPGRIRRILDAAPAAALSRGKSFSLVCLCMTMLGTFLACNLGPSKGVDEAPEVRQRQQQSDAALHQAALALTPERANALKTDVKAHPSDPDKMAEIVIYYQSQNDLKALDALQLWFIGEHPDVRMGWGYRPEWDVVWDKDGYARAARLWAEQLRKSWSSPYVYMNAAEFFSGTDNERAEQILLDGQRKFPAKGRWSGLHWEVFLARHYAWALMGSEGQLPGSMFPGPGSERPAPGPYAQTVRETLLASKDTELLTRTVWQLLRSLPNREFCRSLVDRALSIKPENMLPHLERDALRQYDVELRARTDSRNLSDSDRMVLLASQLYSPFQWRKNAERDLLMLAAHNTNDPNYGTAIFLADIALGEAALQHGDKAEALRLLLAASEAPPTEFLRYHRIDMSLAQGLFDGGEREGVATFLDRCAKFNAANMPLAQWAAQIRKGQDPKFWQLLSARG